MKVERSAKNIPSLKEKIFLNGNALKVIAIIAMTIDHLAWMGVEEYSHAETTMQIILHCIGRLTAPIMFFFVAEGYHYTRNYWKYLSRMVMLAVVSHFAFCYFAYQSFNPFQNELFNATSIIWPLMWGLIFLLILSYPFDYNWSNHSYFLFITQFFIYFNH